MKIARTLIICLFSFFALQACMIDGKEQDTAVTDASNSDDAQKEIIVYGSDECSHCVDFKNQLDSAGLEYTFYDVEKDQSKGDEMLMKVQRTGFQGYIRFPVVEVDGIVRVAPSFDQFEKAL
jgi:glutaredoxin